ncbi:hypothetical protein [Streptomyces sp. NPDC004050]
MSVRPDFFAVEVSPAGGFHVLGWYPTMSPQGVLGADSVAQERLAESLVMWTDDYAAQCVQARNAPVEGLLALYRRPRTVTGRVLVTGPVTAHGVAGLSFDQALTLLDRLLSHAAPSALDRQVLDAS